MKARDVIDLLSEVDPDRTVVIPTAAPRTARECCEVKEVQMEVTEADDFIPSGDPRQAVGNMTVVALVPMPSTKKEGKSDGGSADG